LKVAIFIAHMKPSVQQADFGRLFGFSLLPSTDRCLSACCSRAHSKNQFQIRSGWSAFDPKRTFPSPQLSGYTNITPPAPQDEEQQVAEAGVREAEAELERAKQELGPQGNDNPQFREALAAVEKAKLDLLHTTVSAPSDGVITNLQLTEGEFVAIGQAALTFVLKIWQSTKAPYAVSAAFLAWRSTELTALAIYWFGVWLPLIWYPTIVQFSYTSSGWPQFTSSVESTGAFVVLGLGAISFSEP
jgi:hypothetical protein